MHREQTKCRLRRQMFADARVATRRHAECSAHLHNANTRWMFVWVFSAIADLVRRMGGSERGPGDTGYARLNMHEQQEVKPCEG